MRKMVLLTAMVMAFMQLPLLACANDVFAVQINEVMASNGNTLFTSEGKDYDWIELYNGSDKDISLRNVCLSDREDQLNKFVFPNEFTIKAGEYLVLFASGLARSVTLDDGTQEIHLPFKLKASGESVVLSYQGELLDNVTFDQQQMDCSFAKNVDGEWEMCYTPTPGMVNSF